MGEKKGFILLLALSLFGYLVGFANQLVLSYYFGTSKEMDGYWIAINIINFLILFMYPFRDALIAIFPNRHQSSLLEGNRFFSGTLNLFLILSLISAGLLLTFREDFALLILDKNQKELLPLVTGLLLVMTPLVLLRSLTEVFSEVLISFKKYLFQHYSRIIGSMGSLVCVLLFFSELKIYAVAIGLMVALAMLLLYQIQKLKACGVGYQVATKPHWEGAFLQLFWILLVSWGLEQTYLLLGQKVFLLFGEGVVSSQQLAMNLSNIPQNILVMAFVAILWPRVSPITYDKVEVFNLTLTYAKYLSLTLVLVSCIFTLYAKEFIYLVYFRGAFDQQSLALTSQWLVPLSLAIIPFGLGTLFARVLLLLKHSKSLLVIGVIGPIVGGMLLFYGQATESYQVVLYNLLAAKSVWMVATFGLLLKSTAGHLKAKDWFFGASWVFRLFTVGLITALLPLDFIGPLENKAIVFLGVAGESIIRVFAFGLLCWFFQLIKRKEIRELLQKKAI